MHQQICNIIVFLLIIMIIMDGSYIAQIFVSTQFNVSALAHAINTNVHMHVNINCTHTHTHTHTRTGLPRFVEMSVKKGKF